MSLDLLDQRRENDPRSNSDVKLPKMTPNAQPRPSKAPQSQGQANPLDEVLQRPTVDSGVSADSNGYPTLEPDVSGLINPWTGDITQLSLGDIQRLGIPSPISAGDPTIPEYAGTPTDLAGQVQQETQQSFEKTRRNLDEELDAAAQAPSPIYVFPDPTEIANRPSPTGPSSTDEWLSQNTPKFETVPQSNPFVGGNKNFSSSATANVLEQSGGMVSRVGNTLQKDKDFWTATKEELSAIGPLLNPVEQLQNSFTLMFGSKDDKKRASQQNLKRVADVFQNVGGPNGSYGSGFLGTTLRILDLGDNAVRGTVADLFGLKRTGDKTGNNLYKATFGGQDYSFFQNQGKGASPFALLPEKPDWSKPETLLRAGSALLLDTGLGVITGGVFRKGLKTVKKLGNSGEDVAKVTTKIHPRIQEAIADADQLKALKAAPTNVPVPKTPANITNKVRAAAEQPKLLDKQIKKAVALGEAEKKVVQAYPNLEPSIRASKEAAVARELRKIELERISAGELRGPRPKTLDNLIAEAGKKDAPVIKLDKEGVVLDASKQVPVEKFPYEVTVKTDPYPTLVRPKAIPPILVDSVDNLVREVTTAVKSGVPAQDLVQSTLYQNLVVPTDTVVDGLQSLAREGTPEAQEVIKTVVRDPEITRQVFKRAELEGTVVIDNTGNIVEIKQVLESLPPSTVEAPTVTPADLVSAIEEGPQKAATDVMARHVDSVPEVAPNISEVAPNISNISDNTGVDSAAQAVRQATLDGDPKAVEELNNLKQSVEDLKAQGVNTDAAVNKNFTPEGRLKLDVPAPNTNAITPDELNVISPVIKPEELVPQPTPSEALKALKENPNVYVDSVNPVKRTNKQLTNLAVFMGHVKPRKSPLSTQQLKVLEDQYGSLYAKLGRGIDTNKLTSPAARIEIQPRQTLAGKPQVTRLIDTPRLTGDVGPGNLKELDGLVARRSKLLEDLNPDNLDELKDVNQKILNHGPIDYTSPENIKTIQEKLPSDLISNTPEGHIATAELKATEDQLFGVAQELKAVEKELDALRELHEVDSLELADLAKAAPDDLEDGQAFLTDVWRDERINQPGYQPFQLNPELFQDEAQGLITGELPKFDWFHGTRIDPNAHDIRFIDPDLNTTLHEMGPGVYLTTDLDSAGYYAKAQPNKNVPYDVNLSDVGEVLKVRPRTDGLTLIANQAPEQHIKDIFRDAAIKSGAHLNVVRTFMQRLGQAKTVDGAWDLFYETFRKTVGEADNALFHRFQVNVANGLRESGYDAILKLPEKEGDEAILNILGRGGDQLPIDEIARESVGSPSLIDAMSARASAVKSTGRVSEEGKYLATKARVELNQQAQDALEQHLQSLAKQADDLIDKHTKLEDQLADLAKNEKKTEALMQKKAADNELEAIRKEHNTPEDLSNPCL